MERLNLVELSYLYRSSNRRIIFLDYEGTLVSHQQATIDRVVEQVVSDLASDPGNSVAVISDRSVPALTDSFQNSTVTLVAESGGLMRTPGAGWQSAGDTNTRWKYPVVTALQKLAAAYPGTSIVEKHFSVKWIFDNGTNAITANDRRQLDVAFRMLSNQFEIPMTQTDRSVEFRSSEVNKGKFAVSWLNLHGPCDFIMAIGSDSSDEPLFDVIGKAYTTIRIGHSSTSHARYFLESRGEVLPLLENLISVKPELNLK